MKKHAPNPLFDKLPTKLKNPKNFLEVEKKLSDVMKSDHTHKTVKGFMTCAWCQKNYQDKQKLLKELGFESYQVYQTWKQIMSIMTSKMFKK